MYKVPVFANTPLPFFCTSLSLKFVGRVALTQLDSTICPMLQHRYIYTDFTIAFQKSSLLYIISSDRNDHVSNGMNIVSGSTLCICI